MSLLQEIQKEAVDGNSDLPTLLRKCKILGSKLGYSEFNNWVDSELNGYKDVNDLPDYRVFSVQSFGHFFGGFGKKLTNAPIPSNCFPEKLHELITHTRLRSPISTYSMLLKETKDDALQEQWPSEVLSLLSGKIYQDMNCLQAWKHIPRGSLVALLDTVRNRILSFVLEIESESPNAGEGGINSNPIPQERVAAIYNTYITGNVQNLASGGHSFHQTASHQEGISVEIFDKMLAAINDAKIPDPSAQAAISVISEMRDSVGQPTFTDKYNKFMAILSDHITVIGPIIAPFLPLLTQYLH